MNEQHVSFDYDPMYLTVFFITRYIERYHKKIQDDYSFDVVHIPSQDIEEKIELTFAPDISKDESIRKLSNSLGAIQYKDVREFDLIREIPNNKAKRFADFEYLRKYKLRLEEYDAELTEKLIRVYVEKHNLDIVDFDDYERMGETIWEYIHNSDEWKEIYLSMLCDAYGDTGMGVYSKTLKHFIPCKFAEHVNAIYEMLRMFDEFKEFEDYQLMYINEHADSETISKMDYLIMNDFKLVGNSYNSADQYIGR